MSRFCPAPVPVLSTAIVWITLLQHPILCKMVFMQQAQRKKIYPVIIMLLTAAVIILLYLLFYQQRVHKIEKQMQQENRQAF